MINADNLFKTFADLSKGKMGYPGQDQEGNQLTQLINSIVSAYTPGESAVEVVLEGSGAVLRLEEALEKENDGLRVTWSIQAQNASASPKKRPRPEIKILSVSTLKAFIDRCQLQRWLYPDCYGLDEQQRKALSFAGADFSAMNLNERDLSGMDLTDATLSNSTLNGSHLSGATLNGADCRSDDPVDKSVLTGARHLTLSGTSLTLSGTRSPFTIAQVSKDGIKIHGDQNGWTDLTGLRLRGATFSNIDSAHLSDADLSYSVFNRDINDVSFSKSNLSYSSFCSGSTIKNVDLSNANLTHFVIPPVTLIDVDFDGANFSHSLIDWSDGEGLYWENVSFRDTTWIEADLRQARFRIRYCYGDADSVHSDDSSVFGDEGIDLRNANFTRARLAEGDFTFADLRGANFSEARLVAFKNDGRPLLAVFDGARFEGATFGKRVNILGLTGADLRDVNFSGTEVYIGVRKLTEAVLDTLLNHCANDHSLMLTIESLNSAELKVKLMEQLVGMVTQAGINLQPFLKNFDILFQPHYFKNPAIQTFFADILLPGMIASANNAPWKISEGISGERTTVLCHALWDLVEGKRSGDFSKFVVDNNGFFIQLVCQSRKSGNLLLKQRAEVEYAKYLALPRIHTYTHRPDNIFGNLKQRGDPLNQCAGRGAAEHVDWLDEEDHNYVLVADSAQEEKTLMLSEKKLAAMLYGNNHSLKAWVTGIFYYTKGIHEKEPALVLLAPDRLENVFNNDFRPFSLSYNASAMANQWGKLWELFSWEKRPQKNYRTLFIQTVASEHPPGTRLTDLKSQADLLLIFKEAFPPEQQTHLLEHFKAMYSGAEDVFQLPDELLPQDSLADTGYQQTEHQQTEHRFSLAEAHYEKLLDALAVTQHTDSEKAQSLISLALFFTHLSSSNRFGNEQDSPLVLRYYASALLARAQALDASVFVASRLTSGEDRYKRWQNKLLGEAGEFSCTAVLYTEMKNYAQCNFWLIFNQVRAVLKPVSGLDSDSTPEIGWSTAESGTDERAAAALSEKAITDPEKATYDHNLILPFLPDGDDPAMEEGDDPATKKVIKHAVEETLRALEAIAEENGVNWERENDAAAAKTERDIRGAAGALFKKHPNNSFIAWLERGALNTAKFSNAAGRDGNGE